MKRNNLLWILILLLGSINIAIIIAFINKTYFALSPLFLGSTILFWAVIYKIMDIRFEREKTKLKNEIKKLIINKLKEDKEISYVKKS